MIFIVNGELNVGLNNLFGKFCVIDKLEQGDMIA